MGDKQQFVRHMESHSQDFFTKCEICGKKMRSKSLKKHIDMLHSEMTSDVKEPLSCPDCQKKFYSDEKLERHRYLNHSSILQCSTCGKSFTDKKVFINHQKGHRFDTPTACDVCGKTLKRSSLIKHMAIHHSVDRPQAKSHSCHICGKIFYMKSTLVIHMKKHYNQKDILCTFEGCNKAFYTTGLMKDHVRVHTGQAIRQCVTCSKEFKSMSAYRYHIRNIHPLPDAKNQATHNQDASVIFEEDTSLSFKQDLAMTFKQDSTSTQSFKSDFTQQYVTCVTCVSCVTCVAGIRCACVACVTCVTCISF